MKTRTIVYPSIDLIHTDSSFSYPLIFNEPTRTGKRGKGTHAEPLVQTTNHNSFFLFLFMLILTPTLYIDNLCTLTKQPNLLMLYGYQLTEASTITLVAHP